MNTISQGHKHIKLKHKLPADCASRWIAIQGVGSVLGLVSETQKSLSDLWPALLANLEPKQRDFAQMLCFGTLRWWSKLKGQISCFTKKPFKKKDQLLEVILAVGIFQLTYLNTPNHAAVSTSVQIAKALKGDWAASVVNGILRAAIRHLAAQGDNPSLPLPKTTLGLQQQIAQDTAHPQWMVAMLMADWPHQYEQILKACLTQAPLCIRVNTLKTSTKEYLAQHGQSLALAACGDAPNGLYVKAQVSPQSLPGFKDGVITIQDESAQLAVHLLTTACPEALTGEALDACAAPGGKTLHWLEQRLAMSKENKKTHETQLPATKLWAIDDSASRMQRLNHNAERLFRQEDLDQHLKCEVIDARHLSTLMNAKLANVNFDAILLDAPCSGSGVMRRHPDIKWLRKEEDIGQNKQKQLELLTSLWPRLKPGGVLLYTSCSIFHAENETLISTFLQKTHTACAMEIAQPWGLKLAYGMQRLPEIQGADGFYYCLVRKNKQ